MSGVYQGGRTVDRFDPEGVADRVVGTQDGSLMTLTVADLTSLVPGAAGGRVPTLVVAAVDASARFRATADYLCDGNADDVEIMAALNALPTGVGGMVLLSEGTFTLAAPIGTVKNRTVLRGMGMGATTVAVPANAPPALNGTLVGAWDDWCEISDLTIDGNRAGTNNTTNLPSQIGMTVGANLSPRVSRVRIINTVVYALVVEACSGGVIRDCLAENTGNIGMVLRAAADQPLVVSGCTVKGSGAGGGFWCDNGPVTLSDCVALSNTGAGFVGISTGTGRMSGCYAQGNTGAGFTISTAPNWQLIGCRSISNTNNGFDTSGAATQFVGCLAQTTIGVGNGFTNVAGATDALTSGCMAVDCPRGFLHDSTGRALYTGCRAAATTQRSYAFHAVKGEAHYRGCAASTHVHGYVLETAGGSGSVDGCRGTNLGGLGVFVGTGIHDVQVTNNYTHSVSLDQNNWQHHIQLIGDRIMAAGNMMRDPAAGNRPYSGLLVNAGASSFVGMNDGLGVGLTQGPIWDLPTTTRRVAKLQLDYIASADLMNNSAVAVISGGWSDLLANQSFEVSAKNSVIEIAVRGMMKIGGLASQIGHFWSARLVVDNGVLRLIGSQGAMGNTYFQNPFTGTQPIKISGLAVGTHTVRVQVAGSAPAFGYLRASNHAGTMEMLAIQVTEFLQA